MGISAPLGAALAARNPGEQRQPGADMLGASPRSAPHQGGARQVSLLWAQQCLWLSCRGAEAGDAFPPFSVLPKLPGCCRGPLQVPFVTLSQALLCQHAVGKWLCLTRTCWVCDLAVLVAASASPKQRPSPPLPGAALPGLAALWGWPGRRVSPAPLGPWRLDGQTRGHLLLPGRHCRALVCPRLAVQPETQPPCPVQRLAARAVGVLTHAKVNGCPCDFLSFICASAG